MKNYEDTLARFNELKEEYCNLGKEKSKLGRKSTKYYLYHPDLVTKYNELVRQLHNVQINLNQIKMQEMNGIKNKKNLLTN